jgi:two-component system sporulation sensor kinase A
MTEPTKAIDKILEISPFACVLMADTYQVKYVNPIMSEFLSLSKERDLRGTSLLEFLLESDHQSFIDFINQLNQPVKEQLWRVFRFVDSDGTYKNILMNGTNNVAELGSSGSYFLVGMPLFQEQLEDILPDIIGQNLLDKFSYNKYASIFENEVIGIAIFNYEGLLEECNNTFIKHIDRSSEMMLQKHYSELFSGKAGNIFDDLLSKLIGGKRKYLKDIIKLNCENCRKILAITLSKIQVKYEGKEKLMLITEDITEEQNSHTALLMAEKLALTGRLAASLAHEINNPLQTSVGCLGLVEEMLDDDDEEVKVYIKMAIDELQRSARIVKKLRDLNRKTEDDDRSPIDIHLIIENVLLLTKNRLYDLGIVPLYINQDETNVIMGSEDQIQQVILNLVINAIDALPDGGNLYLDVINTEDPKGIKVTVRDTGTGIPEDVMDNLFDPFFTTKDSGLGLGLFICKQIVEDHRGYLEVESEVGKGTEFSIWLPKFDITDTEE